MSSSLSSPRYLTFAQAAEYLQVSTHTLRKWVNDGKVVAHRNPGGKMLRFDPAELDAAHFVIPADELTERAEQIVADFPPLSEAQIERIAALLRSGGAS